MEELRIFKCEVGGVPGAEAASGDDYGGMGVFLLHQAEDFAEDILFVLEMPDDPFGGGDAFGIETFLVDTIQAIDLDATPASIFRRRASITPQSS